MSTESDLSCNVDGGIATLTFNRPTVMNALSPEYLRRFIATFQEAEKREDVRVIVLTGAGKAFSSGGEKAFLRELLEMTPTQVRDIVYASFLGAARTVKESSARARLGTQRAKVIKSSASRRSGMGWSFRGALDAA